MLSKERREKIFEECEFKLTKENGPQTMKPFSEGVASRVYTLQRPHAHIRTYMHESRPDQEYCPNEW